MSNIKCRAAFLTLVIFGFTALPANALTMLGFVNITNNNPDIAVQLTVDVIGLNGSQVQFNFYNTAVIAANVTEIYFDDGSLLELVRVINNEGPIPLPFTNFVGGAANPGKLPGGNMLDPKFEVTQGFLADAAGNFQNGLNTEFEVVGMLFNIQDGRSIKEVLEELKSGALRIGLHVQSIGIGSGSDSFVNAGGPPVVVIPEPSSILLLGLGLIGLFSVARIRIRQKLGGPRD